MAEVVYLNGRIVPAQEAVVSADDRGLLYGDALFETMRAYSGRVFRIERHMRRFRASADFLGFDAALTPEALAEAVVQTVAASGLGEAYVRMTVSRGRGRGLMPRAPDQPTVMIEVRELSTYPARLYRRGATLVISRYGKDEHSPLVAHKVSDYLLAMLAKREAAAAGCDDASLLNGRGEAAEATVSNLFAVKAGKVLTPPPSAGILPGITRAAVIELCQAAGIQCAEQPISRGELFAAEEAFLTNTLMEILPVRAISGREIGRKAPGPLTRRLARAYRELVLSETML